MSTITEKGKEVLATAARTAEAFDDAMNGIAADLEPHIITIDETDTFELPSAYEGGLAPSAPFRIADDDVADWAIQKLAEKKAEYDRLSGLAEREIARITERVEAAKRKYEADSAFLTDRLAEYFETVPHRKTKTTEKYQLLHGTLTKKLGGITFKRDDAKLIEWLRTNGRGDLVKVKEEPAWGDLKKLIDPTGAMAVLKETGEIVEGIEVEAAPDTFKVDV